MAGRREYRRPPIVEATFAAYFDAGESWGFSTPGALFDRFSDRYPVEPKQINGGALQFANDDIDSGSTSLRILAQQPTYEFSSKDSRRLIRVSRNDLTVHMLAPYRGWNLFRLEIMRALSDYIELTSPVAVNRLGIRYVNNIDLKLTGYPIELNDYFNISVDVPESLGFSLASFFNRSESAIIERNIKLIQTFASTPGESPGVLLDLDVIKEPAGLSASPDQILVAVDELRELERMAFEAAITDALREVFDADR